MPGSITLEHGAEGVARLTLANPAKLNAIDIAMWRELQALMLHLQALPPAEAPHAVVVCGAGGHFAAGGDIVEFAEFRFVKPRCATSTRTWWRRRCTPCSPATSR